MKNYEEFCTHIEENILDAMSDKTERRVVIQDVRKNNNVTLKGLTLLKAGNSIAPTIYLEGYYDEYCHNILSLDEIVCEIAEFYERSELGISAQFDFDLLQEDHIIGTLVSKLENEGFLSDIPYVTVCNDFALVFKYFIPSDLNDGYGTITITDSLAEKYSLTLEKLFWLALTNTPTLLPVRFNTMFEELSDSFLYEDAEDANDIGDIFPMYLLSNESKVNGASALLYPNTRKMLYEKFDGDLVLLPSSIHEWIVIPSDKLDDFSDLADIIQNVNETALADVEKLGEKAYVLHYADLADQSQLLPILEPVESYRV